jgi:hypothetical protein
MQKPTITHDQLRTLARPLALWRYREEQSDQGTIRVTRVMEGYIALLLPPDGGEATTISRPRHCAERAVTEIARIQFVKSSENIPHTA